VRGDGGPARDWVRGLASFRLRLKEPADVLGGAALTALRFVRCAPPSTSPRPPDTPSAPGRRCFI